MRVSGFVTAVAEHVNLSWMSYWLAACWSTSACSFLDLRQRKHRASSSHYPGIALTMGECSYKDFSWYCHFLLREYLFVCFSMEKSKFVLHLFTSKLTKTRSSAKQKADADLQNSCQKSIPIHKISKFQSIFVAPRHYLTTDTPWISMDARRCSFASKIWAMKMDPEHVGMPLAKSIGST